MNFKILLPTILVIFSLTANAQTSVIGGENTARNDYPSMVELTTDGQHHCGGILISPRWVLTAGHCVLGAPPQIPKPTHAMINLWERGQPHASTEKIEIDTSFAYPGFSLDSFGQAVDLGLIRLAYPSNIDTATIANSNEDSLYEPGVIAKVLGWGVKDSAGNIADTLKIANVKLMHFDSCVARYNETGNSFEFAAFNVCGEPPDSAKPEGAGSGDSGGPLIIEEPNGNLKVIGVVSGGRAMYTTYDKPGLYTKVNLFKKWVDSVRQAHSPIVGKEQLRPESLNLTVSQDRSQVYLSFNSSKTDAKNWKLNVYDLLGRRMYSEKLDGQASQFQINKSALNSDFAIISITGEAGTFTKKVIVR